MQEFKNTKVRCFDAETIVKVQQAMFVLGFKWKHSERNAKRQLNVAVPTNAATLFVDEDCRILFGIIGAAAYPWHGYREVTPETIYVAAAAFKDLKRMRKREQRRRAAERRAAKRVNVVPFEQMVKSIVADSIGKDTPQWKKWEPTKNYRGIRSSGPVEKGVRVDVKYRDGIELFNLSSGNSAVGVREASGPFWLNEGMYNDIVAYRLHTPAVATADKVVSFDELVEAIEASEPAKADPALDPLANPKQAIGNTALPMTMISPLFRAHVALAKYNGMLKYGGANYIGTPVVMSTYLNAMQRHLDKILLGEEVDEVDGVNHFGAIGANCDIILSAAAAGTLIDDRLRGDGQLDALRGLKSTVVGLQELHKGKTPKHFYAKDA